MSLLMEMNIYWVLEVMVEHYMARDLEVRLEYDLY